MKKVKLKNNNYLSTESIVHRNKQLSKFLDTKITIGQEIATNEYIGEKRVYAKIIQFADTIKPNENFEVPHQCENLNDIWVDVSNSYIIANDKTSFTIPMILYYGGEYSPLQVWCDSQNILFRSTGGWGEAWRKVVKVKYTKTDE